MSALHLLPKNAVSRAFGAVSDVRLPPGVRGVVNRGFALYAGIDLKESARPPGAYASLNEFFTRELKDDIHRVEARGPGDLVSPADGRLDQFGKIESDTLLQAKGRTYRLVDLLDSAADAERFSGGHFATVYLSPRDYHRVHSPASGSVNKVSYIPGHLWPVNPMAVEHVDELFAVNERLISYVENDDLCDVATVMVGATCVGRMTLAFHDVATNGGFRRRDDLHLEEAVELEAGDELGMFNLGSTVVLVVGSGNFEFESGLKIGTPVRMGQLLGRVPAR
jgi:phosphatidylserine decarboxylase